MRHACDYCGGPVPSAGPVGRPLGDRPPGRYCCYGCLSLGEQARMAEAAGNPARPFDWGVARFATGLLVAGQSMAWSLAVNLTPPDDPATRFAVQGVLFASSLVVLALLGPPLALAAGRSLVRGTVTAELLFVTTLLGALAASLQSWLSGAGAVYFEVVSVLLVVYTLGRLVGARGKAAALASARVWADSLATCRLVDGHGRTRTVPVAEVLPGDVVEVRAGEAVSVDGIVRAGVGFVAESAVTGEPFAVVRRPGDRLLAGAASHDATFRVEATVPGTARRVDRLLAVIEDARQTPTSFQAQADRLAAVFLPVLLLAAVGTFVGWTVAVDWRVGLFNAMSVLLVACPCALGLATPIVVWTVLARLAERGLVVRSADVVERLARADLVLFDKTGTLTDDRFALLDVATADGVDRPALLARLAAVQAHSPHPAARPFADAVPAEVRSGVSVESVRAVPGCGVEAVADGHRLRVGRPEWLASEPGPLADRLRAEGHRVDVEEDGRLVACAVLAERLRDTAVETLAGLRRLGVEVEVLTGDAAGRAERLGLPSALAALLPDDKARMVRERLAAGRVPVFVGDGLNDAAALAAASVGVALSSGTDLANGAASATLYHGDLRALPWALALCRRAVRVIRWNLWRAAGYNLVGVALAAAGVLHPLAAAILMVASSLFVAWSSASVGVPGGGPGCGEEEDPSPRSGEGEKRKTPPADPLPEAERGPGGKVFPAALHALALALQGPILAALLAGTPAQTAGLVVGFALAGAGGGWLWRRWAAIPHAADMAFGMLTLGNLGMVAGWWADSGFAPVAEIHCAMCSADWRRALLSPWMWAGMLLGANAAMTWLPRRPHGRDALGTLAMCGGGNLGMLAGMAAGGWLAGAVPAGSTATALALAFGGMSAGMLGGMWAGDAAVRFGVPTVGSLAGYSWRLLRAGR